MNFLYCLQYRELFKKMTPKRKVLATRVKKTPPKKKARKAQ